MSAISWTVRGTIKGKSGNEREVWQARYRRQQAERARTEGCALVQLRREGLVQLATITKPVVVTFTRVGKRLLDTDAVPAVCANVRDQVACMLGVTDGPTDTRVSWRYQQRKGEPGVEVEVRSAAEQAA